MKIVLIGKNGQLGSSILKANKTYNLDIVSFSRDELNITHHSDIENKLLDIKPDIVINSAAYTFVDKAEEEKEKAFLVNADASLFLSKVCLKINSVLIHISTDYVFDGESKRPYLEEDLISPIGVYGKSKALGEENIRKNLKEHIIIRTSWLYSEFGQNFVKTMLKLKDKKKIDVVNDQFGSPTYALDLASAILKITEKIRIDDKNLFGTYHFSNYGQISWYDFAKKIFELIGCDIEVESIPSEEYKTACKRPAFSVLNCKKIEKAFGIKQIDWLSSLKKCLKLLEGK